MLLNAPWPIRHIGCEVTSRADSAVTLACGRRVLPPACPVSFWTRWLKPLTSDVFCRVFRPLSPFLSVYFKPCSFSSSSFLFTCRELCPSAFVLCVVTHCVFFCITFPFPISLSFFLSFYPPLYFTLFFPRPYMNGVFAEECGGLLPARGLQCHRSQLIYPLPLSSCYAWSLNLPFLLFFPCYSSQIPLSDFSLSPHSALIFIFYPLILSEHDTCSINVTGFIFLSLSSLRYLKICHESLVSPSVMYSGHLRTLLRILVYPQWSFIYECVEKYVPDSCKWSCVCAFLRRSRWNH